MVDCRPAAGAPHELAPPNGQPPPDNHHTQASGSGELGGHAPAPSARASTPAAAPIPAYTPNLYASHGAGMNPALSYPGMGPGAGNSAPYVCGVKSLVWCASPPPPHAPPPPPHGVNPHVFKSVQANGADLPMNDIPTLRYYFNLGVECMWSAYGPPPPHHPPRHYSPRDLAQDMQQMNIHDRNVAGNNVEQNHKHKPGDKPPPNAANNKPTAQRPLLPPRFKRGGNNQDGNQNSNHNQNKGHNNNMGNKGPNNRQWFNNSRGQGEPRGGGGNYPTGAPQDECVPEPPLLTLPYIPYPPPLYPIPYYPVESDPAMMGMMGGMGYVGYEEGGEYGPMPYYPHYPPPPHPHLPPPHTLEQHK